MKGCGRGETNTPSNSSHGMMAFTAVLGFMFLLFWFCVRRGRQANANLNYENEPNAEPADFSDPTVFGETLAEEDHQQPADGRQKIEPTVEGYLNLLTFDGIRFMYIQLSCLHL